MSEFTPGPWETYANDYRIRVKNAGYNKDVAFCFSEDFGAEEHSANASLIAAAPDMWELLQDIEAWFQDNQMPCPDCQAMSRNEGHKDGCQLLEIIKKVEGEDDLERNKV
jgi:hypothetical protein